MKIKLIHYLVFVFAIALILPAYNVNAASAVSVTTKAFDFKGQKYIQLTGGIKSVTDKINKELRLHAVAAAGLNSDLKKKNSSYSYLSSANTKYNNDEKMSIVVVDVMNAGGAHGLYTAQTYNYDLRTGKRIQLGDIAKTNDQISNLFVSVSAGLSQLQMAGKAIYDESIFGFKLTPNSLFYFYDNGIVVKFSPYEVAPFSEGFVDVKVPYTAINATPYTSSNSIPIVPNNPMTSNIIESKIDDDFEGYDEGNIYELANGQIWKQVDYKYSYRYSYRPDVLIYKDGSRYYMKVEGMKDKVEVERLK